MKKVAKLSLVFITTICMFFSMIVSSYAVIKCNVTISGKSEVTKGEQFTVNFNLSNFQSDKGINALVGTLKYDKDSLTLVKIEGQNKWSNPSYNEANGTFLIERDDFTKSNGAFLKLVFKVKDSSKSKVNIALEQISVSNDVDEINVKSVSKNIIVKSKTQTTKPATNTKTPNTSKTDSSKNNSTVKKSNVVKSNKTQNKYKVDNTTKSGKLPQTGDNITYIVAFANVFVAVAIVTLIKMKVINKKR